MERQPEGLPRASAQDAKAAVTDAGAVSLSGNAEAGGAEPKRRSGRPASLSRHWLLFLSLLIVLGVSLHFCLWKSGMFIDEIYTYGLANSSYMPFIGNGGTQGDHDRVAEQTVTREDFFDYLAVTEDETRFDAASVYYNQVQDVHPPLYYWILNFCSSLAAGHFSKWIGLVPDLLIYLGTLALLYALGLELFGSEWIAACMALLYGLSQVGLSTMLMIRMYVLVTFLTVLLAWLTARELRAPSRKKELCIAGTIFLGLMTQYYFVFYAFFLCAAAVIALLCQREWKAAGCFTLFSFLAVGLMLLSFPAVFDQMFGNRLGPESDILTNIRNASAWVGRLRYYFGQIRAGLHWSVVATLTALLLWLGYCLVRRDARLHRSDFRFLILLLPVIPTVCIPAIISPVLEGRYIYNIMPICTLAAGFGILALSRQGFNIRVFTGIVAVLALIWSLRTVPDYIYDEHRDYTALVQAHADAPCVYITGYYAGPTQDMLQLMVFDDVHISEDPASEGTRRYLAEHDADECVVYVDVDAMWGDGFNSEAVVQELLDQTDYTASEHLYRYALSDAWLLTRSFS